MPTEADILFRDFVRYTGDGLPNEPVGKPAPIGDPASGIFNPPKKNLRDLANVAIEARDAAVGASTDVQGATLFASDRAALLANTAPSYAAGTVFATRSEGYSYQVVSSDPDLTTAGGVGLRALPGTDGILSALAVGAKGDGSDDTAALTRALSRGVPVDGAGRTYLATALPDFANLRNMAVKVGGRIYPTRDYLKGVSTSKISAGNLYTAWAQDKSYVVGHRIHVWAMEKESHTDGTGRIVLFASDEGGASFDMGEYLHLEASGMTLWAAGYDPFTKTEYLMVRVPEAGTNDVPPYVYRVYRRTVDTVPGVGNVYGAWIYHTRTFPTPTGFTGQPIMVHSFTSDGTGAIVVGASYGEGAAVMRSTDQGATWTAHILGTGSNFEEPTVKYDPATGRYYGFMRAGTDGNNPMYWHGGPAGDLSTISVYTAPQGTFGPVGQGMSDTCVPLAIHDGRILAFASYRNGTLEGSARDKDVSMFMIDAPAIAGNIWSNAGTRIMRMGNVPHIETAGASAVGQGSVLIHENKFHMFYGMEERTGATASLNRVANIYQTIVPLRRSSGVFDFRDMVAEARHAGPMRRMPGGRGFAVYRDDLSGSAPALVSGRPNFAVHANTINLVGGVLDLTGIARAGVYKVGTENSDPTDDMTQIIDPAAVDGDVIILRTSTSARDVTVKHGVGNIFLNSQTDKLLSFVYDRLMLQFDAAEQMWFQIAFGDNA